MGRKKSKSFQEFNDKYAVGHIFYTNPTCETFGRTHRIRSHKYIGTGTEDGITYVYLKSIGGKNIFRIPLEKFNLADSLETARGRVISAIKSKQQDYRTLSEKCLREVNRLLSVTEMTIDGTTTVSLKDKEAK